MAFASLRYSNIRLTYEAGYDEFGEVVTKSKTYNNIHPEATADQIYEAATSLASLSELPLFTIERNDRSEILN